MSKIKRIFLIFMCLIVLNLVLIQSSFATNGTITGSTVRVRKEPSTDSAIIINVFKNDKIEVIEPSGEWYKVKVDGAIGYVHKDYIKVDENDEPMENIDKEDEDELQSLLSAVKEETIPINTEKNLTKDTIIYAIPLISSIQCDNLSKGKTVTALETLNSWIKISYDGKVGWIRISNLNEMKTEETIINEEPKVEETKTEENKQAETSSVETKVGYINGITVNIRKEPSTSSGILTQLDRGSKIEIISTKDRMA